MSPRRGPSRIAAAAAAVGAVDGEGIAACCPLPLTGWLTRPLPLPTLSPVCTVPSREVEECVHARAEWRARRAPYTHRGQGKKRHTACRPTAWRLAAAPCASAPQCHALCDAPRTLECQELFKCPGGRHASAAREPSGQWAEGRNCRQTWGAVCGKEQWIYSAVKNVNVHLLSPRQQTA